MNKKLTIIISSIIATLAIGYGAGALYFQSHFLPSQVIQGVDVGLMKSADAQLAVETAVANQPVKIETIGENITTNFADLGVTFVSSEVVETALANQNHWTWPFGVSEVDAFENPGYRVDENQLQTTLLNLGITNPDGKTVTTNASIEKTETEFSLVPEVVGTLLDETQVHTLTKQQLERGATTISLDTAQIMPTITTDVLAPVVEKANQMVSTMQTLKIREDVEPIPTRVVFASVDISETNEITIDASEISAYVNILVNEYTQLGSEGTLNTSTMQKSGGMSGSTIAVSATTDALVAAIESGKSSQTTATMNTIDSPTQIEGIGNTYVQISISEQHLWFYKDGKLVLESAVLTGDPTQGWDTITGVYSIQAKQRDATLEGYSYGWDYAVPVKYWMPIFHDGTGLHDADWQPRFGGNAYVGGGSHGCINMPPAFAETFFNAVSVGTPVVLY